MSPEQVQKPKATNTKEDLEQLASDDAAVAEAQAKPQADTSDLDDLLDEIDGLLEEQDVLVNYVQKGGQ